MTARRIAFTASDTPEAQSALHALRECYAELEVGEASEADIVVALGGDGFMLRTLHALRDDRRPIYGMNLGSIGFLLNQYSTDSLVERLEKAEPFTMHPLKMQAEDMASEHHEAHAINDISLLRETQQTAKIRILIDDVVRMEELICDGVLICTPPGSTAYNLSAHGPALPISSGILGLTPISAFRPRRWRGALLPHSAKVIFECLDPEKRPVSATADGHEVRNVVRIAVAEDTESTVTMLFDPEHDLNERILKEQFTA